MLRVGVDAQASTDEQVGPDLSITNQVQQLERHLQTRYTDQGTKKPGIIRRGYREEGQSGENIAGRPEPLGLPEDMSDGTMDAIACAGRLRAFSYRSGRGPRVPDHRSDATCGGVWTAEGGSSTAPSVHAAADEQDANTPADGGLRPQNRQRVLQRRPVGGARTWRP